MPTTKSKKKEHVCLTKWRKRIDQAEKRMAVNHRNSYGEIYHTGFTEHENSLASSWNVCAVGEAHKLLPDLVKYEYMSEYGQDAPQDETLERLGINFVHSVNNDDINGARKTIDQIEKRLNQLYVLV